MKKDKTIKTMPESDLARVQSIFILSKMKKRKQSKLLLKPLPILEGCLPEGWKDKIYDE